MDKQTFINYCATQLQQVFNATKQGKPDLKTKHQVEGLLRAAELLEVLSREQAVALIEQQHLAVFGVTAEQRAERKRVLAEVKGACSEAFFDIPAIERRK